MKSDKTGKMQTVWKATAWGFRKGFPEKRGHLVWDLKEITTDTLGGHLKSWNGTEAGGRWDLWVKQLDIYSLWTDVPRQDKQGN